MSYEATRIADVTSAAPLSIQMTDDRDGSDVVLNFPSDRLDEVENFAKEIISQIALFRDVRKRSDELAAMFVQMGKNAQAGAKVTCDE